MQLVFYNTEINDYVFTNPKVFGNSDCNYNNNDSRIIEETTLDLAKSEQIYLIKGKLLGSFIVHLEIQTSKGQYISVNCSEEALNFLATQDLSLNLTKQSSKSMKRKKKKQVTKEFYFEFLSNGKIFDGLNAGWNSNHINFMDFIYKVEDLEMIEKKLLAENYKVLADYSDFDDALINEVAPINKSSCWGKENDYTVYEDDYHKIVMKLNKMIDDYQISSITVYFDKFINCIEVEYRNKYSDEKLKLAHSGLESKL